MNNHLRVFAALCERGQSISKKIIEADIESSEEFKNHEDVPRDNGDYINGRQYDFMGQLDNLYDIIENLERIYSAFYIGRAAGDDGRESKEADKEKN